MKVYTHDEARSASLAYFDGDEFAADVFVGKYALHDLEGNIYEATPAEMHRRLAREFARIEAKYPNPLSEDEIFELFADWTVVPQGSPMAAIGNPFQVQSLSNCFVIESPYDSYGGITKTDQEEAQIMKRRGGVGIDVSTIRPKGLAAANAARTTDGLGVFMERFSNTCREVAQGGRRGALMLTVSVHHPDVLTFVNIKRNRKKVTGANVSVRVTEEFMQAVKEGKQYQQRFPVDATENFSVERMVDAREVWLDICTTMRDCSEPGILFWDTITKNSPADIYADKGYKTMSTNPCGELPLSKFDSCRLLLLNLAKFVESPFASNATLNTNKLFDVAVKAQRLMDDLVDLEVEAVDKIIKKVESDPEPENVKRVELELWNNIRNAAVNGRRTGLGITALGDMIAYMNEKYGSERSIVLTEEAYRTLALGSYSASLQLAEERGAFPAFDLQAEKNADNPFLKRVLGSLSDVQRAKYESTGRRNISNLTTAPAGSTSLLTRTTSGCEPVLFIEAKRFKKINPNDKSGRVDKVDESGDQWQSYKIFHNGVNVWMNVTGETDVTKSPYHGSTVEEIDIMKKVEIQAAAQLWVDHSISNTVNLPREVTAETVERLCYHAWETGCKGITSYRVGSRDAVIVKDEAEQPEAVAAVVAQNAPKRPKELNCDIHRATIAGEAYLVLVGTLDGKPYEIFAGLLQHIDLPRKTKNGTLIKNGKNKDGVATYNLKIPIGDDDEMLFKDVVNLFDNPVNGALTRTLSLALRHGIPTQYIVEQLRKDKNSDISSFSAVIARVLSKAYVSDGTKVTIEKACSECNSTNLKYQQGCVVCFDCGNSKC